MAKTYFAWFTETFSLDQTNLVNSLLTKDSVNGFATLHCPDYYVSKYNICLQSEEDKNIFIGKHKQSIVNEQRILQEIILNTDQIKAESFFTSDKIQQIKECIQEIEVQTEILELINQNLQLVFASCKWFPFNNKTLFDLLNFVKLPLIVCGNNYWLGVLPDKIQYERQRKFHSILKTYELPEDSKLTLTKLHTWVDIEYKKITINEPLVDFERPFYDAFRTKARKIARQKISESWEETYVALHNRELS